MGTTSTRGRRLRRLAADVRAAWRGDGVTPRTPQLRDYPLRRRA